MFQTFNKAITNLKPAWLGQNVEWLPGDATSKLNHELETSCREARDDKCAKESREFSTDRCCHERKRIYIVFP